MDVFLPRFPSRQPAELTASTRRRFGRFAARRVYCSLGRVMDLSARGVRLERRGPLRVRPERCVEVTIRGSGMELHVQARVIWVERQRLLRYTVGLEFQDISEATEEKLAQIAHNAALTPTLGHNAAACEGTGNRNETKTTTPPPTD